MKYYVFICIQPGIKEMLSWNVAYFPIAPAILFPYCIKTIKFIFSCNKICYDSILKNNTISTCGSY